MGFVAPLLFAGLVAVAIPIFIHLIQRERKRVVEFPSLMFLRRIPYQSVRRRRIRHWPLLLLRLAGSLLAESALARREAILISDYQRGGWGSSEDVRLPDRAVFTPVDVGSDEMKNVAVTPVSLQRTRFENQERIAVTAGVINRGGAPIARLPIALELDGKVVDTEPVDVAANGSGSVTFAPFTVSARNMRAAVRIPDDSLRRDNVFDFVVSPIDPLKVTVLERPALSRVEGEGAAG